MEEIPKTATHSKKKKSKRHHKDNNISFESVLTKIDAKRLHKKKKRRSMDTTESSQPETPAASSSALTLSSTTSVTFPTDATSSNVTSSIVSLTNTQPCSSADGDLSLTSDVPVQSFAPPSFSPLINLTAMANNKTKATERAERDRVIERERMRAVKAPPKPLPTAPSYSVLKKKTAAFNG